MGLSYITVSLLTIIPSLCLGIFAFAAPPFARRFGREQTILWATICIGLATMGRLWSSNIIFLLGTTILVGVGIAIAQTLLPSLVSKYFPEQVGSTTGLYTAFLLGGSGFASVFTVPATNFFNSWSAALALWSIIAIVAALVWFFVTQSA